MRLIGKGKVRDLYAVDEDRILFVASDRVSAFDVVLENCTIPNKGRHLTRLSVFWFNFLGPITRHHLLSAQPEIELTGLGEEFQGRSLLVQRCEVLPLEAIVRGYLCGSAWSEYSRSGTINGEVMPEGLSLYDKLPRPLFTPTTKAELGEGGHDLPLTWAELTQRIGPELADRVKQTALKIYETASEYASRKGVIIADTKLEFGLLENKELLLIDEVLTPDSSRFWLKADYEKGKSVVGLDKQLIRDWLVKEGEVGNAQVLLPREIIIKTQQIYEEITNLLIND